MVKGFLQRRSYECCKHGLGQNRTFMITCKVKVSSNFVGLIGLIGFVGLIGLIGLFYRS